MKRNEVGALEEIGELEAFDPELRRAVGREKGVGGDHPHPEALGARGHE